MGSRIMSGKKGKSGGARSGSGPKRTEISEIQINTFYAEAEAHEKKTGKSIPYYTIKIATQVKDKRAALQAQALFYNTVISKYSEKDINLNEGSGPKIYAPKRKPDPATLKLVKGDKK